MGKRKSTIFGSMILSVLLCLGVAPAQEVGTINGKVVDTSTGDPIIGVNVIVKDRQIFAVTDINGSYLLQGVPAGEQVIQFQMMGYAQTESKVVVKPGKNPSVNVVLTYKTAEEVVVTAKRVSNTEASLISKRKKSAVAQDAISSEQIGKTPDSDAADVAKRVTGVTVVGEKYIYVRGLSERYSSIMFAGSAVPSPDPDRRIVPLDIFPASLIDNMIVVKAYSPDMPGEFGGGVVQINPMDYPAERFVKISLGTGYQFDTSFQKFYSYNGGSWDWFGVDDGTRSMPSGIKSKEVKNTYYSDAAIENIGKDFTNTYTPDKEKGGMPISFGLTYGDTYKVGSEGTIGLIFSGMFKESYKNKDIKLLRINDNGFVQKKLDIEKSTYSTTKGLLLSLAYNPNKDHKLRMTGFYTHMSSDNTSVYNGYLTDRDISGTGDSAKLYKLQFVTTGLFFGQLSGEHYFEKAADMKFDWTGSYSFATRDEPDTRSSQLVSAAGTDYYYVYRPDDIKRRFQTHEESVAYFSPSFTFPFKQWTGLTSKVKFGASVDYRDRENEGRVFAWESPNFDDSTATEPLEDLLGKSNIGNPGSSGVNEFYIKEVSGVNNSYSADMIITGTYALIDIPIVSELRALLGLRYEYADMNVYTFNTATQKNENLKTTPLTAHNFLPALSMTWNAANDMNLRFAFSKTLTRPDFRECTDGKWETYLSDEVIVGNPELTQTDIYNADLRYEWFIDAVDLIAVSFFYKYIIDPVEMLEITGSGGTATYQYMNSPYAHNLGGEIELRKSFDFITKAMKDLSVSLNVAYIYSKIKVENNDLADYSTTDRAMQGQSPWVVNAGLHYDNNDVGFSGSALFNIAGRRIIRVGTVYSGVKRGDVYEEPAPRLDVVLKQRVMKGAYIKLSFENLIDPEIEMTQKRPNVLTGRTKNVTIEKYHEGRSIGFSYTHTF